MLTAVGVTWVDSDTADFGASAIVVGTVVDSGSDFESANSDLASMLRLLLLSGFISESAATPIGLVVELGSSFAEDDVAESPIVVDSLVSISFFSTSSDFTEDSERPNDSATVVVADAGDPGTAVEALGLSFSGLFSFF